MNPAFEPVLKTILARLAGARGQLERAAAFTRDGEMQAAMQLPGGRTGSKHGIFYNMTSSSLIDAGGVALNRRTAKQASCTGSADRARCCRRHPKACKADGTPAAGTGVVRVPTVDFGRWLSSRFCKEDYVLSLIHI